MDGNNIDGLGAPHRTAAHLEPLDISDQAILLLRNTLVVQAMKIPLPPKALPGGTRSCCYVARSSKLCAQRSQLLPQLLWGRQG